MGLYTTINQTDIPRYIYTGINNQNEVETIYRGINDEVAAQRTANLFDYKKANLVHLYPNQTTFNADAGSTVYSVLFPVEPGTTYSFSFKRFPTSEIPANALRSRIGFYAEEPREGSLSTGHDTDYESTTERIANIFTPTSDTHYVLIMFVSSSTNLEEYTAKILPTITIQKSSTSVDFVPFGYQ